jgi:acyl-CoA thioester hydrolase
MNDDLFRFSTTMEVRWRDLDALEHVNNAVYLTYLEQGRVHYMQEVGLGFQDLEDVGMILAEVTCTYRSPLSLAEQVTVWVRVSELRNSSFIFEYRMEGQDGRVAATGRSVQVCYDYENERSIPLPDRWRELLTAYEPGLDE